MKIIRLFLILLLLIFLFGCKAVPAKHSGFIKNPEIMYNDETLPFQKIWVNRYFRFNNYKEVVIKPVIVKYMLEQGKVEQQNFRNYLGYKSEDEKYIAQYTQRTLIKAFSFSDNNRFKISQHRGFGILSLEIALVEVVPAKVSYNTANTIFTFIPINLLFSLISYPIRVIFSGTTDMGMKASVAFEAVIKDSVTGKVLMAFADREVQKASLVHVNDYRYFSHIEEIIDEWAVQTVKMFNRVGNEEIIDSSAIDIKPW